MIDFESLYRHLVRRVDMRLPEEFTWRKDRLIPILDTSHIRNLRQLEDLIRRYVPTVKAVRELPTKTAFVALEVKPKFGIGGLFDVSLALLPKLEAHVCNGHKEALSVVDFIMERQVKVVSFRVNMIGRDEIVKPRATAMIVDAMRKLCEAVRGQNITLIGFSLPEDIKRIGLNFAHINEMFPYWIDLSRMIRALSPILMNHQLNMKTILDTFGYDSINTTWVIGNRIVVNEAVRTLTVLEGLQCREGVVKLILRERRFPGIDIEPHVEAFRFMPYKALIHNYGSRLPPSIDSAQKLALAVEDYRPIGVAADICDPRFKGIKPGCPSTQATHMTRGCVCFKGKEALEEFINNVDGSIIDGVTIKVENIPYKTLWKSLKEAIKAKGTSIYDRLETAVMEAKETIPRWYSELYSPVDGRIPWCPNPEDAPPGYYDTDDDSITYARRLWG